VPSTCVTAEKRQGIPRTGGLFREHDRGPDESDPFVTAQMSPGCVRRLALDGDQRPNGATVRFKELPVAEHLPERLA
jgi:hypothetical protein